MKTFVAAALLLLPAVASAIDEILTVTGPGREAPVMEDSDQIPVWDLTMEHRCGVVFGCGGCHQPSLFPQ